MSSFDNLITELNNYLKIIWDKISELSIWVGNKFGSIESDISSLQTSITAETTNREDAISILESKINNVDLSVDLSEFASYMLSHPIDL